MTAQRSAHSAVKRGRSTAGASTTSRLTMGPRLSAVTPQTAATHRVVQFLNERTRNGQGYNEGRPPATYKDLVKGTGRDFDDVFTFMYGFFSPLFTMDGKKREEEVPALMKMLGYPGLITKSHLVTIGCAHSWPPVIAMLSWLADQVDVVFGTDLLLPLLPSVDNNGFAEVDAEECAVIQHAFESYDRWLSGQDQDADAQRNIDQVVRAVGPLECGRRGRRTV
ncbi:kinetochore protein NDC80 homolog [Pollicipes pollicipes]|uniref:kinetochore protein NDC80 homolog n=1 Tax=Pollicipes pollicipes TaxID=41117 RepID=UPI0018849693|nr:kinetochore protein NDC80 homolog [Pollicipes pollicipes]